MRFRELAKTKVLEAHRILSEPQRAPIRQLFEDLVSALESELTGVAGSNSLPTSPDLQQKARRCPRPV